MGNNALKKKIVAFESDEEFEESWRRQQVVTVLRWDGVTMEFARELKLSKLLKDFPGCAVCRAAELGSVGKGKMLSPETALERGVTYLLLPRGTQQHQDQKQQNRKPGPGAKAWKKNPLSDTSPILSAQEQEEFEEDEESAPQTVRILMTKKQLARMIGDGSLLLAGSSSSEAHDPRNTSAQAKDSGLWSSSMKLSNHPQNVQNSSASMPSIQSRWSPELDSIVELLSP